jgi:hypothetical protein
VSAQVADTQSPLQKQGFKKAKYEVIRGQIVEVDANSEAEAKMKAIDRTFPANRLPMVD